MSAQLLEAADLEELTNPLKSTSLSSEAYVLALANLPSSYAAAASAPSNRIDIYDKESLRGIQTLAGHEVAVTSLSTVDLFVGSNQPCLISSGKDGLVSVWDQRSGAPSVQMTTYEGGNRPLLCCDVSVDGTLVAAGTDLQGDDAIILYWDVRKPNVPLRKHTYVHSDDITAVHFLKSPYGPVTALPQDLLLSASSDGLISISNAHEDDEDESVLHVGNFGCSVAQAGWIYDAESPRIWASSDMETFSVWSQELDQLQNLDIRGPSVHTQKRTWVTDYLITGLCAKEHWNDHSNLMIYAGSNEGDIALLSCSDHSDADASWTMHRAWTHGHEGIVRSLLYDEDNHVLLTGGEDGRLNLWSSPSLASDSSMNVDESTSNPSARPAVSRSLSRSLKRELEDGGMDMDDEMQGKKARKG
ncbi:hypothetical protein EYR40_005737 [Pleurotus pulmonarius]|nr:hypothetical protein EYR40_005737 [Pleurotus pulmonarius]